MIRYALILCFVVLVSACTSTGSGITTTTNACCANADYQSFTVEAVDIPAFLGPLMVSNFSVAFASHGLQPVQQDGDLQVLLRYEQTDLSESVEHDDFDERIEGGGEVRFIARMVVDMKDPATGDTVWSGSIQRIHDVSPGEYMHTGRASLALLEAFTLLLEDYPGA